MSVANEVTMHEDTRKEYEIVGQLGYKYCVECTYDGPLAWFFSEYDAKKFVSAQSIPINYLVVYCKKETNI